MISDDLLLNLLHIRLILLGEAHLVDSGTLCGQYFLFDSAHGQDQAAQGDFTGHRHGSLHFSLSKDGGHSREQRNTRRGAILDRKSTRLNSSHVASSYAVFCVKKKNLTSRK